MPLIHHVRVWGVLARGPAAPQPAKGHMPMCRIDSARARTCARRTPGAVAGAFAFRRRDAAALLEVLLAAAILGIGLVLLEQLVDAASTRVYQANLDHLVYLFTANIHARYAHVRPADLAREFNDRAGAARVLARDPVLGAVWGQRGMDPGSGLPDVSLHYAPLPGAPGIGRLESTVTVTAGDRSRSASRSTIVYGRKLPALPPLSVELADTSRSSQKSNADLVHGLEAHPDDAVARIVLPLIRLEAAHGAVTRPYAAILDGARTDPDAAAALEAALARETIPDGIYACDWVTTPLWIDGTSRAAITFLLLTDALGTHRLVCTRGTLDPDDHQISIAGSPGLDLGEVDLLAGRGPAGVTRATAPFTGHLRVTRRRVFALSPRLTPAGTPDPTRMEMSVVTFPAAIPLDPAPWDVGPMRVPIFETLRLVGLIPAAISSAPRSTPQ